MSERFPLSDRATTDILEMGSKTRLFLTSLCIVNIVGLSTAAFFYGKATAYKDSSYEQRKCLQANDSPLPYCGDKRQELSAHISSDIYIPTATLDVLTLDIGIAVATERVLKSE